MSHPDDPYVPSPPVDRHGRPVRSSYPAAESGDPLSWTLVKVGVAIAIVVCVLAIVIVSLGGLALFGVMLAWLSSIGVFK